MGLLTKIGLGALAWEIGWHCWSLRERNRKYFDALHTARKTNKPFLVVGKPCGPTGCYYGCGDVTLDLRASIECPGYVQGSVEAIPFPDKHFSAVFCSHVLEHTCNPQKALSELHRVADKVFISYPRWWQFYSWYLPGHAWLMFKQKDDTFKFKKLRDICNVAAYYGDANFSGAGADIMEIR